MHKTLKSVFHNFQMVANFRRNRVTPNSQKARKLRHLGRPSHLGGQVQVPLFVSIAACAREYSN